MKISRSEMTIKNTDKDTWQYWEDLPKEQEDELIEKIAQYVVKHRLGLLAQFTLESVSPISRIGSEIGLALLGPYFEFFGAAKHAAIFRKRQNVDRLINRIEELEEKARKG